jgi:Pyridoxamine 5'-phosphate oxidase
VNWQAFAAASPELAALGRERFQHDELCMLGTLRGNGWPRISPCELDFVGDELLLGMMWQSPKARDLLRDDRCLLHSCTSDRMGTEGDFKLYGRAREQGEEPVRDAYRAAIRARIDWEPTGPFHLFAIEIESAGYLVFGERGYGMAWDPKRGTRRWPQRQE